jgi:hypothetical protein
VLGVIEFIEKEFWLHRLEVALKRLLNNPDPAVEGGHDHASPDALHLVLRLAV